MNLAINGFGRIGRQCFRIICEKYPDINVVLINDLSPNDMLAHLLEHDSTYGHYACVKKVTDDKLVTKHGEIKMTDIKDPSELPHKEMKVDVVLECTGVFRKREGAQKHLDAGAKKVIISAPAKDEIDGTFVMGVNHETYEPSMDIISNASCTTMCLAPMVKVLHDNFTVKQGFMTTIHSWTSSQKLVDGPDKDWRRARSAMNNLIPTTTGAAKAVGLVLPELQGKLDGMSIRTPTLTGSIVDLTSIVEKEVSEEEVNAVFKKASDKELKGILGYEEKPLVLVDYVGDPRSSIVDALSTKVHTEDGITLVKTLAWYDNEWGYSNRMVELAQYVGGKL
ncbi:MAG: type I glyceraldehyde-3-phosphate dehydrogenase [Candidatus Peribacteraceae bacterium]|jgi:glyceraldehyde 3-phosphate dehydrogenase|nr:type I glyceraldehyde-3-phosphate dehydrogenase [Candidatus Peribacteraceae bacterium]MDP7454301.1 type I glyceraldehyde-3-phosphate dehydrogenase [Candidatus Peribacteraceae bacterium]MDP7645659.1 type I glyceraldehyde-3-phosphate dehydrogenase [Candidatus Peribacteraceae bacterium]|tara:strand:+ start:52 stop:1062 length:1011 start_codon:yes stop_codon:yes gene_type:complete